ncbi:MAG: hypothetical protein WD534_06825 [Phycisphaeraceae bacterium]
MNGNPTGGGLTTVLYAVLAFGLIPTSMVLEVLAPVLGHGLIAQACYWTSGIVALGGLAKRCFLP